MIVVLMGVTGSGKTTLGQLLADQLGWTFVEGDAFHPEANVQKMRRGEPLTDADRAPWLRALRARIDELAAAGRSAVVACSALKQAYRDVLADGRPEVVFVHLTAPAAVIRDRLDHRRGHYMPPALLDSQLATLEPPAGACAVDVTSPAADGVAAIRRAIGA
jgi:gluconokinase